MTWLIEVVNVTWLISAADSYWETTLCVWLHHQHQTADDDVVLNVLRCRPDIIIRNIVMRLVEVLLYVHRNCRFIGDGSPRHPPRLLHSSWALSNAADEVELHVLGCLLTWLLGANCDQCRRTVQYCFTSTETIRLVRSESPGRPSRLSHSSWTMAVALDRLVRL